ncbi:hypothetical protein ANME2D_01015 [Candidatus Methanoperedens nitroreducens]|uniref:Uncharacterized protein n=1 Tax=Candidatus Methanoperedens nitratireducens TaxID=1392998 RepID=A0A062V0B7_9EURY|nr:hypothetical protein [Candidatus Methanoperedens nitroreducens]KCZ72586.1 hypothetical protein ANME2D_01015 [Candidatus Methanoperedens nitroreducens]MDJ1423482.1 hypothetical protein [Candidatus Methanoperedens sp.]
MDMLTVVLITILLISFFTMYLMHIRMKQLRKELNDLRDRVTITGEELMRLSSDIEDFKKINI